jgi:KDO2-lipid IV(A) lauroyltransferase
MATEDVDEAGLKIRGHVKTDGHVKTIGGHLKTARFHVEATLVRVVSAGVALLPMAAVRRCGHGLGRVMFWVDGFHRRIALENLAHAFPSRPAAERRALAKAMFAHFGALLFELLKFGSLSREEMAGLIEVEGMDRVANAHKQGRGVFFVTGHFGYWEMQAIAHPFHAPTIAVLARPLDNPLLHALLERLRTMTGNRVAYRQGALRRVLRELAANNGVAMLIDQHLHTSEAVYVDYFGRPAATTSALAALALRTGAVVIPVFALPLPGGRYRFIYEHPVEPPPADAADPVVEYTQRCTDVLEMYVRRHPELWLWMHRRWREREPALAGDEPRLDEVNDEAGRGHDDV